MRSLKIVYLLLSLLTYNLLQSCSTVKRVKTSITYIHDTLTITIKDTTGRVRVVEVYREKKDTVLKVPGSTVTTTYAAAQLTPAVATSGKVPHSYVTKKGSATSTVSVDTAGKIGVTCECDSVQLVLTNLLTINSRLVDSITHINRSTTDKSSYTSATYTDYWEKTKFFLSAWRWWLLAIIAGGICAELIYRHYRNKRRNPYL